MVKDIDGGLLQPEQDDSGPEDLALTTAQAGSTSARLRQRDLAFAASLERHSA